MIEDQGGGGCGGDGEREVDEVGVDVSSSHEAVRGLKYNYVDPSESRVELPDTKSKRENVGYFVTRYTSDNCNNTRQKRDRSLEQ